MSKLTDEELRERATNSDDMFPWEESHMARELLAARRVIEAVRGIRWDLSSTKHCHAHAALIEYDKLREKDDD
jgi:hypothetical protein